MPWRKINRWDVSWKLKLKHFKHFNFHIFVKIKHNILKWKVNSKLLTLHVIWLNNGFIYNNVVILAISQNKHIRQQNCLVRLFTSRLIFPGGPYKRIAVLKNDPKDDPISQKPSSSLILKPFVLVHCLVLTTVVSSIVSSSDFPRPPSLLAVCVVVLK